MIGREEASEAHRILSERAGIEAAAAGSNAEGIARVEREFGVDDAGVRSVLEEFPFAEIILRAMDGVALACAAQGRAEAIQAARTEILHGSLVGWFVAGVVAARREVQPPGFFDAEGVAEVHLSTRQLALLARGDAIESVQRDGSTVIVRLAR